MSRHLAALRALDIVEDARIANRVFYRLNPTLPDWALGRYRSPPRQREQDAGVRDHCQASRRVPQPAGVHQGLLRHSAAVKRTAKEGEPNGRNDGEGRAEPAELSERPQEAGGDKSAGGPPTRRFSAKRKLRAVSRLLRGEPLELLARELNVTAARLSQWRERALLAAEAALKERERDDRDDEIARLKGKVGEMTMETELLREKIARLEAGAPLARRRSRR